MLVGEESVSQIIRRNEAASRRDKRTPIARAILAVSRWPPLQKLAAGHNSGPGCCRSCCTSNKRYINCGGADQITSSIATGRGRSLARHSTYKLANKLLVKKLGITLFFGMNCVKLHAKRQLFGYFFFLRGWEKVNWIVKLWMLLWNKINWKENFLLQHFPDAIWSNCNNFFLWIGK